MAKTEPTCKRRFGLFGALMLFLLIFMTTSPLFRDYLSPSANEVWFWATVRPGVTRENFERIRKDMQQSYVDRLMGCKPSIFVPPGGGQCCYWATYEGPAGRVIVEYWAGFGEVCEMTFVPAGE
jgi:hypothetical protein